MKTKLAFTLLEVLLALLILVSSVTIFSSLQVKSIMRMWLGREYIDRVFLIEKDFYDVFFNPPKKEKSIINLIEKPDVKITSQILPIDKKSELSEFKDFIEMIKSEGEWKSSSGDHKLTMISFILNPEE